MRLIAALVLAAVGAAAQVEGAGGLAEAARLRMQGWSSLERARDAGAALRALRRAVELDPGDLNGQKLLALAAFAAGQTAQAVPLFRAALVRDPGDVWVWTSLGRALTALGEWDGAGRAFDEALARRPEYAPALEGLRDLLRARSPSVSIENQRFTDSWGFEAAYYSMRVRAALARALSIEGLGGRLDMVSAAGSASRRDVALAVGWRPAPRLEIRPAVLLYRWSGKRAAAAPGVSATWVGPGGVLMFSVQLRGPVDPENLTQARLGLSRHSVGGAFESQLLRSWSAVAGAEWSAYSDRNQRRSAVFQLSRRLTADGTAALRVRYEIRSFLRSDPTYFSPSRFQTLEPGLDIGRPVWHRLAVEVRSAAVWVVGADAPGWNLTAGSKVEAGRYSVGGWFTTCRIPVARAWSGNGFRLQFSSRI
jgi:hypothetical protein